MFIFDFYRRLLMLICAAYGLIRLVLGVWRLMDGLAGPQRQKRLIRGYLGAVLASVRLRRFRADLLQIAALAAVLAMVLYAHRFVM